LGMATPYLLLGVFPELIRFLPKPGAWMETLKELMGFFLLATVVFLFSTMHSKYFVPTLAFLVGLWLACWWIGRTSLTASGKAKIAAWLGGPTVAALIGWGALSFLEEPTLAWQPDAGPSNPGPSAGDPLSNILWQPFSPESLAKARSEGKTVLVYFTANWCLTCKFNLKMAIDTAEVRQWIAQNGVIPLLADWTDQSPVIKKALNDLGYNSIPVAVIWPADPGRKPIILPDLITQGQLLQALESAGPSRSPLPP
jgi:suppressor for copper-sensitivity B